jgi:hypothetical protein
MMGAKSAITPLRTKPATGEVRNETSTPCEGAGDFSDPESQRVLSAAAVALARELGRQAAREYFASVVRPRTTTCE